MGQIVTQIRFCMVLTGKVVWQNFEKSSKLKKECCGIFLSITAPLQLAARVPLMVWQSLLQIYSAPYSDKTKHMAIHKVLWSIILAGALDDCCHVSFFL